MQRAGATFTKVCGVTNTDDVDRCTALGVNAVGIILTKPDGSPRSPGSDRRTLEEAAALVAVIGERMQSVLLIHVRELDVIVALHEQVRPAALQVQVDVDVEAMRMLRDRLPGVVLYKRFAVEDNVAIDELAAAIRAHHDADVLDAAFLDGARGGSGATIDWSVAAELVARLPVVPIVLAGGLKPENVGAAVRAVRPYGVDVMSGLNAAGTKAAKDPDKLRDFVAAVRAEDRP